MKWSKELWEEVLVSLMLGIEFRNPSLSGCVAFCTSSEMESRTVLGDMTKDQRLREQ